MLWAFIANRWNSEDFTGKGKSGFKITPFVKNLKMKRGSLLQQDNDPKHVKIQINYLKKSSTCKTVQETHTTI